MPGPSQHVALRYEGDRNPVSLWCRVIGAIDRSKHNKSTHQIRIINGDWLGYLYSVLIPGSIGILEVDLTGREKPVVVVWTGTCPLFDEPGWCDYEAGMLWIEEEIYRLNDGSGSDIR